MLTCREQAPGACNAPPLQRACSLGPEVAIARRAWGQQQQPPRVRKELRSLTPHEKQQLVDGINIMFNTSTEVRVWGAAQG